MDGLRALVTTHNEERNLPDCLASLSFCQEIWVVDSFSTDATAEIARAAGAIVHQREYLSPSDQKNWALDQMGSGWILILDADERVSPQLENEIREVLADPRFDLFWIPRRSWFLGKPILHCGWERDGVIRLLRHDAGRYAEARVHEKMVSDRPVGKMRANLLHYSYHSLDDYLERMLRYSHSGGRQLHEQGRRGSIARILSRPPLRFLRMYLLRQGWRDGAHGLLLCLLSALQVCLKHAIHWAYHIGIVRDES